jgi:outer membrane protein TolC
LERGQELLRQLRLRDGIDVRNDQLLRAEAAVAARQTDLIRAEYDLINAQDQLINVSIGPKYGPGVPEQIEFVPAPFDLPLGIQFEPTAVAQSAIQNRPEIEQSIAQLRAAAVRNHVLKNQVLPTHSRPSLLGETQATRPDLNLRFLLVTALQNFGPKGHVWKWLSPIRNSKVSLVMCSLMLASRAEKSPD